MVDVDAELSKKSIKSLGDIALKVPDMAVPIVKQLCTFINLQKE